MHKFLIGSLAAVIMLSAFRAEAHEHQMFEIGGRVYEFVIGSLNEPVTVDDKTGVDLRVAEVMGPDGEAAPVAGLETELKVELIAGDKRKVLDLEPAFGVPGGYRAPFYPTVQTTYSYRVFGSLNGTPVDLTFTCNPAGHPVSERDETRAEISPGVVRTMKGGAFGCPVAKADMGFPEPSASLADLSAEVRAAEERYSSRTSTWGVGLLALAGLGAGVAALRRKNHADPQ